MRTGKGSCLAERRPSGGFTRIPQNLYCEGKCETAKTGIMSDYEGTVSEVTLGISELAMSTNAGRQYAIVWEFWVRPGCESQFEQVYGSEGEWSRFFRTGQGYVGTELMRDRNNHRRYLTIDFWRSPEDYESFRQQQAAEYQRIDQKSEQMTEHEREFGTFASIG